mgnify:CR=1 FL=1
MISHPFRNITLLNLNLEALSLRIGLISMLSYYLGTGLVSFKEINVPTSRLEHRNELLARLMICHFKHGELSMTLRHIVLNHLLTSLLLHNFSTGELHHIPELLRETVRDVGEEVGGQLGRTNGKPLNGDLGLAGCVVRDCGFVSTVLVGLFYLDVLQRAEVVDKVGGESVGFGKGAELLDHLLLEFVFPIWHAFLGDLELPDLVEHNHAHKLWLTKSLFKSSETLLASIELSLRSMSHERVAHFRYRRHISSILPKFALVARVITRKYNIVTVRCRSGLCISFRHTL